jgi:hypothetical protein
MNIAQKISTLVFAAACLAMSGCTGDFAQMNTNPKALVRVLPEELFYTAQREMHTAGTYWMASASKGRWMRYGMVYYFYANQDTFAYVNGGFGNEIYATYNTMGGLVTNIDYLADTHENAAGYANLKAMARVMLIAKAIHTSDMWGSLAYSEAWQARAGNPAEISAESLLPKFQTQEELSAVWDAELKACVQTLGSSNGQVDVRGFDTSYGGDAAKWMRAANGLRLRLATRLLKRDPATARKIAAEVLAPGNAQNVMGSPADSYIIWFDPQYANIYGGDWHSPKDLLGASKTIIEYMEENEDPRKRMFFRTNKLTPELIAGFNDWCLNTEAGRTYSNYDPSKPMEEQSNTFKTRYIPDYMDEYEGSTSDPLNRSTDPATGTRTWPANATPTGVAISFRPANAPQVRLFKGIEEGGNGGLWFPVMTHADFCFQAAEFVLAEGVASSKTAQQWYEEGVKSSLAQWNAVGAYCGIHDYKGMTADEVATFLAKPKIAWGADPAFQLEQIRTQAWVDNFKNYDESWAQWKRHGMPNQKTSIVTFEYVQYPAGVELFAPRRAKFTVPNPGVHNYDNLNERLKTMQADPDFGELSNEWGRLWWDKK